LTAIVMASDPLVVGGPYGIADESHVRWLRLPDTDGAILAVHVNCNHLEVGCTHPELGDAIGQSPAAGWETVARIMRIETDELVLMHGATSGHDNLRVIDEGIAGIGEAVLCKVMPGDYRVEYRNFVLPHDVEFRIVRLAPA
jgi:hypothetical protein